jgi:hypothetical protein
MSFPLLAVSRRGADDNSLFAKHEYHINIPLSIFSAGPRFPVGSASLV